MKMKKFFATMMSVIMTGSLVLCTGCGKGSGKSGSGSDANTLEIFLTDAGYGTDWCYELKELFAKQDWVKEKYPGLEIKISTSDDQTLAQSKLSAGEKSNNYDLLFGIGMSEYYGKNGPLMDLTESVYNTKVPGEDVLFKDKMEDSFLASFGFTETGSTDVAYYATPWVGGMEGILYNEDLFTANGLKVPNTTDELAGVCAAYKAKGKDNYSFIQSYDANYFDYLFFVWWAQYEGVEEYENYFNGINNDTYSTRIFEQKGREYSLEVFEKLLDYDKGYVNPLSFTQKFVISQSSFINGDALMHANGDWFSSEMLDIIESKGDAAPHIKMMRTPVISRLGEKLGITDQELSDIVAYVDAIGAGQDAKVPGFTSSKGYTTEKVVDAVKEARSVVYTIGNAHSAVIPNYAAAKDVAADFLCFMATDEALDMFAQKTVGATLPFKHKLSKEIYDGLALAQQSRIDYFQSENGIHTLIDPQSFPLVRYGGLTPFLSEHFYQQFASQGNTKTPADYMQEMRESWNNDKFSNALKTAGLQ